MSDSDDIPERTDPNRRRADGPRSPTVSEATIGSAAVRSTKASAKLEGHEISADFVRPASVKRLLAARQRAAPRTPTTRQSWSLSARRAIGSSGWCRRVLAVDPPTRG
jgi:hypothetical protein